MRMENNPMEVLTETYSEEEQRNYAGGFCGFVLLEETQYDLPALLVRLQKEWQITPLEAPTVQEMKAGNLVFEIPGAMITVEFLPTLIPEGEAVYAARHNADWADAVSIAENHKAHLMVAVLPLGMAPLEAGKVYVKLLSSCLAGEHAMAVYTSGTVLEPGAYQRETQSMREGELPIHNWIYLGTYETEAGSNAYTVGMDAFGKDELEILGSRRSAEELKKFLFDVARHVLVEDITLHGEALVGFAGDEGLQIQRRDGVMVEGHSIQIAY